MQPNLLSRAAVVALAGLAKEVGAEGALLLQELHYMIEEVGTDAFGDGMRYVQLSHGEWAEALPWTSARTVRRTLDRLAKMDRLVIRRTGSSFANWYALPGQSGQGGGQNGHIEQTVDRRENGPGGEAGQNGQTLYKEDDTSSSLLEDNTSSKENDHVNDTLSVNETTKESKKPKSNTQYYTYKNYDFSKEEWIGIRRGEFPSGHNRNAILIGAYLVAMQMYHPERKTQIARAEFGGRLSKPVSAMLAYFVAFHDDDEVAGLNAALDYIRWFCSQEENDFITQKAWAPTLCFALSFYRDAYAASQFGRDAKRGSRKSRKGALGLSDSKWLTLEEREKYINDDTVEEYSF
jgi:hypothetical protein